MKLSVDAVGYVLCTMLGTRSIRRPGRSVEAPADPAASGAARRSWYIVAVRHGQNIGHRLENERFADAGAGG
ncbi:hypothetical protein WMF30_32400 [Sorangium sp. So ce134]